MKPKLLDLFCGAGGCAVGYHRAGFDVFGVDIQPQPRYPFEFVQADALVIMEDLLDGWPTSGFAAGYTLDEFDAIHASPPCQAYSRATAWRGDRSAHPDLIAPVRSLLEKAGRPHVIESVQEGRRLLRQPILLCGSIFGLRVQRHRYFEVPSLPLVLVQPCQHRSGDLVFDHGGASGTEAQYRDAMGCDWMTTHEARQAIPPAYTEWIGRHLMAAIEGRQAA